MSCLFCFDGGHDLAIPSSSHGFCMVQRYLVPSNAVCTDATPVVEHAARITCLDLAINGCSNSVVPPMRRSFHKEATFNNGHADVCRRDHSLERLIGGKDNSGMPEKERTLTLVCGGERDRIALSSPSSCTLF
jgi:hypothetical protein